ncbi:DUF4040 domain-containing protein [Spirulina sp. CS-785/01]|uniref:DUF4040 domain-containing protein n=1 Tax=Spirulina sp. CS-785/01 TaxID=3021716 RepID=UPI00232B0144|nr:DUF4040 domain-containing protein [Spirulina sp. CS-785/01]MDB9312448.1 DUF4040 domain-containing protein [Spirulina sp. CS-785/01]
MIDIYTYVIIALLPLAALILVFQVNPYHALVIRAILGAVASLVYAVLGAADVALTEALVGTMLAITLYVVAVRSSLVMRLGILEEVATEKEQYFTELIANLRQVVNEHHLRLELVSYPNSEALDNALKNKEIHATCTKISPQDSESEHQFIYQTAIRVHHLFEIMQNELTLPTTTLNYINLSHQEDKH